MEQIQVEVDTSELTPPRGFPDFDKLQLDPVRREYMRKMRIDMLDYNEEYLSKHPQVEAIMRLIVMEIICHKPFDVRTFIRQLLMSDNLETRVAKIILSKRINLERAHTREYFKHVAEWESKARRRKDDVTRDERGWPEPRPQRKETMEDKAEYSHLHYFKEPYWLYPKEMVKIKKRKKNEETNKAEPKLALWQSAFLTADYIKRWGDPTPISKRERKKANKCKKILAKKSRKPKLGIYGTGKPEVKETQVEFESESEHIKRINREHILKCPTCRRAVAGLEENAEDVSKRQKTQLNDTQSHGGQAILTAQTRSKVEASLRKVARDWMDARQMEVRTTTDEDGQKAFWNKDGEKLEEVCVQLREDKLDELTLYRPTYWDLKVEGEDITFLVPEKELGKSGTVAGPSGGTSVEEVATRELPRRYTNTLYQVMMHRDIDEPCK